MTAGIGTSPKDPQFGVGSRFHFYPIPPDGFDPLTATPAEHARYGIPPMPNSYTQPRSARFWREMYAPPLTFLKQQHFLFAKPPRISEQLRVSATGQHESSLNWSGAYITPHDGLQFTEIHGRWRVPLVNPPAGLSPATEYSSSTWIGLDGQRRYFDSSLPQIGTTQSINDPKNPPYWAWCQWWLRGNAQTFIPTPLCVSVAPGQIMMASIIVLNETKARFAIENRTTNEILTFDMDAPTDQASNMQAKISGATAEWIMERPTRADSDAMYDLPDYGRVRFSDSFAIMAHVPSGGVPGPGREHTLDGSRLTRMYQVLRQPSRTDTASNAETPDLDSFDTTYVY